MAREQAAERRRGDHHDRERDRGSQRPHAGAGEALQRGTQRGGERQRGAPADRMRAQVVGLDTPAVSRMRLHPQRDRAHHDERPRRPQHVAACADAQRQCERGPQCEQLPRVGAGLIGLAEVGEQSADREQREQAERRARRGPPQRAGAHHEHDRLQQREAAEAAERVPIRRDPEHDAEATQRRGEHRDNAAGSSCKPARRSSFSQALASSRCSAASSYKPRRRSMASLSSRCGWAAS